MRVARVVDRAARRLRAVVVVFVVGRQGVRAGEVEALAHAPAGRDHVVGARVCVLLYCADVLGREVAMCADVACRDALGLVAEEVGGEDVCGAEDDDDNARCDNEAPEGEAEGFLGRRGLVQVAECGYTSEHHGCAEREEGGVRGEEGPVSSDVAWEKGEFGEDKGH